MSAQPDFMNSEQISDLKDPQIFHDRVLNVGGEKFYVVAGTLAAFSEYFRGMFYGNFADANKKDIDIEEVDPKVFEIFLYILCEKSNSDLLKTELLIPMIDLAYRFLAPRVLKICKEFADRNFKEMDKIIFDLLETACKYNNEDLKKNIVTYLKNASVISNFDLILVGEYANRLNIEDFKEWLSVYAGENVTFENIISRLDFAQAMNMSTLKTAIADKIPAKSVIPLMKYAFQHDVQQLKNALRNRIYNCREASRFRVNGFMRKYIDEILALPKYQRDFILKSVVTPVAALKRRYFILPDSDSNSD